MLGAVNLLQDYSSSHAACLSPLIGLPLRRSGAATMARNPVQFQEGLSLSEFTRRYGTEEKCEAALIA